MITGEESVDALSIDANLLGVIARTAKCQEKLLVVMAGRIEDGVEQQFARKYGDGSSQANACAKILLCDLAKEEAKSW